MNSMFVFVALTGLFSLGVSDACSFSEIRHCSRAMERLNESEEPPQEEICTNLRNASNCFNELHSRCPDFMSVAVEHLQSLNDTVQEHCNLEQKIHNINVAERCVENSHHFLRASGDECLSIAVAALMEQSDGSNSQADIRCVDFSRVGECIKDKLVARCGELSRQVFDAGFKQAARLGMAYGSNNVLCFRRKRFIAVRMASTKFIDKLLKK